MTSSLDRAKTVLTPLTVPWTAWIHALGPEARSNAVRFRY